MNNFVDNLKSHCFALAGTGGTWLGVLIANKESVTFWLQSASYLGAILVSAVTVWSVIRKNTK